MIGFDFYIAPNEHLPEASVPGKIMGVCADKPDKAPWWMRYSEGVLTDWLGQSGVIMNMPDDVSSWTWDDVVRGLGLETGEVEIERKWIVIGPSPLMARCDEEVMVSQLYMADGVRLRYIDPLKNESIGATRVECVRKMPLFPGVMVEKPADVRTYSAMKAAGRGIASRLYKTRRTIRVAGAEIMVDTVTHAGRPTVSFVEVESSDPSFDPAPALAEAGISMKDLYEVTGLPEFSMRALSTPVE